ncbi:hypothetical protein NBRC116492_07200 [Aurantivibrio infirmus]
MNLELIELELIELELIELELIEVGNLALWDAFVGNAQSGISRNKNVKRY